MPFPLRRFRLSLLTTAAKRLVEAVSDGYDYIRDLRELKSGSFRPIATFEGALPVPEAPMRAAVVAVYPAASNIPFTLNLLRGLAENEFFVLVVATKPLTVDEKAPLLAHSHRLIERKPIGRDLGSYKRGLEWLEEQPFYPQLDTVALINDSMYYPAAIGSTISELLRSSSPWMTLFEQFSRCAYAGSFFQIFKAEIFKSPLFEEFWDDYEPLSSRRHTINKGELGLSHALASKGGWTPFTLYSSTKVRQALCQAVNESPTGTELQKTLYLTLGGQTYNDFWGRFSTATEAPEGVFPANDAQRTEMVCFEMASRLSQMMESANPTHAAGLLCNTLFQAPLKRDLCYRGVHTQADVLELAKGFSPNELESMRQDLWRKGNGKKMNGISRILFDFGRR
jgi:hypothetical protein